MPCFISINRTAMALIYNDKVKEVWTEIFVSIRLVIIIGQSLIQGKVDFIRCIDFFLFDNMAFILEMLKVTFFSLRYKVVSVS